MRKSFYYYYMRIILNNYNYAWIFYGYNMKFIEFLNEIGMIYSWNITKLNSKFTKLNIINAFKIEYTVILLFIIKLFLNIYILLQVAN